MERSLGWLVEESSYRQPKRDLRKENVNCGPRNHFLFPPFRARDKKGLADQELFCLSQGQFGKGNEF